MLPFNLRFLLLFAAAVLPLCAEWTLYVCMATTKGYFVGSKLLASGLARRTASSEWQQVGHNHPFMFAVDASPNEPANVFVAAGNGLIRIRRQDGAWKILTSQDVTELSDLSIDSKGAIYFGHSAGIRVSADHGETWREISGNLRRKYTEAVRADRSRPRAVIAGGEDGLWRTANNGESWQRAGAAGLPIMHIEQSPHDPCFWLAATQGAGVFASHRLRNNLRESRAM